MNCLNYRVNKGARKERTDALPDGQTQAVTTSLWPKRLGVKNEMNIAVPLEKKLHSAAAEYKIDAENPDTPQTIFATFANAKLGSAIQIVIIAINNLYTEYYTKLRGNPMECAKIVIAHTLSMDLWFTLASAAGPYMNEEHEIVTSTISHHMAMIASQITENSTIWSTTYSACSGWPQWKHQRSMLLCQGNRWVIHRFAANRNGQ